MRILVVDDHTLFREGLVSMLNMECGMQVVGEAGSVAEAVAKTRSLKPEVILMDFLLPDGNGVMATQAILADLPETKIIFLTIHEGDEQLFAAIRSGAKGYMLKITPLASLAAAIRSLANNQAAISREMMSRVMDAFSHSPVTDQAVNANWLEILTEREIEILTALADEPTNHEIAEKLIVSETTIKNHIHNILAKLGLKNRYQAAQFARRQRLGISEELV